MSVKNVFLSQLNEQANKVHYYATFEKTSFQKCVKNTRFDFKYLLIFKIIKFFKNQNYSIIL